MPEALFEINKQLCESFPGLDPLKLLNYPAEDVFRLINDMLAYNRRRKDGNPEETSGNQVIRRKAGDNWF